MTVDTRQPLSTMGESSRIEQVRGLLDTLNNDRGLFVARLSEPLLAPIYSRNHQQNNGMRSSDVSSTGVEISEQPTPASLRAELAHYKASLSIRLLRLA